ncbi:MAG TPA: SDR family oxidoreductase [Thermoanaerobaculia bacterium]|nr:SDR family oxidoreductase [Thermoanaerobaculia bacterium]
MNLASAKVLVTGGTSGIGLEIARQLRHRGASVAICGRDRRKLESAAEEIGAVGLLADVAQEEDAKRMVAQAISQLGGLDTLVNNAGYGTFAPLVEQSLEEMRRLFATNVFGAMVVGREAAKHFVSQQIGNIINISSTAGQRGFANGTAYVASKFALDGMTECWRAELRKHNIRVSVVHPSEVQTEFFATAVGQRRPLSERKLQPVDIAHAVIALLEMNDRGFVPELAVWATNPE